MHAGTVIWVTPVGRQQISQASARLVAGRDGKVAAAIRDQQDAVTALATIQPGHRPPRAFERPQFWLRKVART